MCNSDASLILRRVYWNGAPEYYVRESDSSRLVTLASSDVFYTALNVAISCILWLSAINCSKKSKHLECRNFPMRMMLAVILVTLSLFTEWQWRGTVIGFSLSWPAPNLMSIHKLPTLLLISIRNYHYFILIF